MHVVQPSLYVTTAEAAAYLRYGTPNAVVESSSYVLVGCRDAHRTQIRGDPPTGLDVLGWQGSELGALKLHHLHQAPDVGTQRWARQLCAAMKPRRMTQADTA